jgi:hypothetical protein
LDRSENDTTTYDSDLLLLNNIFIGAYVEENGVSGYVQAYNYFAGGSGGYTGDFPHNPGGQIFLLRERKSVDDELGRRHMDDAQFFYMVSQLGSGFDFLHGSGFSDAMDVGGFRVSTT